MPELDSLELKVEADAKKADSALDSLIEKLQNLSKTLGGVNTNNIKNIASAINGATNSNGIKVAQKSVDNLNRSIKNIGKGTKSKDIEIIRTDGAIKNLSGFENALKEFDSFIEESGDKVSKNGFLDTPLQNLKENLAQLKKQFPEAKELIQSYQEEIKMIQNMQAKSANTGNAQKFSGYSVENAQKTLNASLGKSIPSATTKSVSGMTTKLSGLKTALSSVAKTASANIFNNFSNGVNKAKTALSGYIKNAIRSINISKGFRSIVGHVRNLYFSFSSLRAVSGILKKSITSAMDYIEEFNYFQNAIAKIANENKNNYKKYGYTNAEAYADSFQSRLTSLSSKMTGFDISKNGELSNSGKQSLGLDVTEVTNFQSRIAQMTNSVGMFGEASIVSAKALTMLAGDMSSLTNVDLSTVMNNFSSGLSGMSMALKKYGIDITNASLKQLALSLGVKKNISDMTQAEKEYLRVIAMVQQSKVSWGDLANTINQPANQFRMLKTNIAQCGMMLGRLFMPMVAKVLPWLNAMTGAIKDLIQYIGDLFGIKWANSTKMNAGTDDSAYTDIADSADDAANSIGNATDKQKEFNKQLQSFDKLNNLTSSKDSSKKKDESKADASGKLSDALIKAVEGYEKRWNKAFNGMSNKSDELKKKIEDLFKGAWLTNDGTEIGKAVANVLNKGINWVNSNTSTWTSGLKKIATIMGTALNGFVSTFNWDGLGKAIGNSIKGALEATQTFFDTVDWTNLGKGISKTLNAAIKTGVIQQYLKTAASVLKSAIETAFGAITTFDFAGLGNAIGQGINDFISKMNEINKKTGLNGWQELGKSISSGISGIVTTITTALKKVKWQKVGDAIGEFISSIDFKKVAWDMGKLAKELLNAIAKAIKGIVDKAPIESAIVALFAGLKLAGVGKAITTALNGKNITLGRILVGLTLTAATFKFFNSDNILTSAFLTPILAFIAAKTFGISTPLALKILAVTVAVSFGFNFGKLIGTAISKATANTNMDQYRYNFKFSDLFTYSPTEWIKGFMDWFNDTKLKAGLQKVLSGNLKLKLPISGFSFPTRSEQMTILLNYWSAAKKLWGNKKLIIKSSITMAQSLFTGAWKTAKKLWGDKKLNIKGSIDMRKPLFLNAWEVAKKLWGNKKLAIKTILSIDEVKTGIKAMVKLVNAMVIDPINAITNVKLPKALGGGRILPKLKRIPVPQFENGGYPNKANLFWANEYGKPELVGRQGSKTVVANNDQIIKGVSEGVSDAVYNAMNPVLTSLSIAVNKMSDSKNGNALYVEGVSDGDIVKIVKNENDQYKRTHNGNPLFA